MKKLLFVLLMLVQTPVFAVPVVPNFSAGSVTSRTESTEDTREIIKSYSYSTGYTYSVGGTNITGSSTISPTNTTVGTQVLNGVSSTWTGASSLPTWSQTTPGAATNFTQSYMGPGLQSVTEVDRTVQIQSITESTSVFTQ